MSRVFIKKRLIILLRTYLSLMTQQGTLQIFSFIRQKAFKSLALPARGLSLLKHHCFKPLPLGMRRAKAIKRLFDSCAKEGLAQSSVEAAILLPALFIVLALLVQPCLIMYSRICMKAVAAEACRLHATSAQSGSGRYELDRHKEFVERRLRAVPYIDIFHMGGDEGWEINFSMQDKNCEVSISHSFKALPLLGISGRALADLSEDGSLRDTVVIRSQIQASWVKGAYGDWQAAWDS